MKRYVDQRMHAESSGQTVRAFASCQDNKYLFYELALMHTVLLFISRIANSNNGLYGGLIARKAHLRVVQKRLSRC